MTNLKKKMVLLPIILPLLIINGCFFSQQNKTNTNEATKNNETKEQFPIDHYKKTWGDTFLAIQKSRSNIKKKGEFNFGLGLEIEGDQTQILKLFQDNNAQFANLGINLFGDYNFENIDKPNLNATFKIYLNQRTSGLGDFDMSIEILDNGTVNTYFNNITSDMRKFLVDMLKVDKAQVDALFFEYEDKKGKVKSEQVGNFLTPLITALREEMKKSPLEETSQQEDDAILNAFLEEEVLKIWTGSQLNDNISRANFKLVPDNLINFVNKAAKILNQEKDFTADKETFKDLTIQGNFDLKNNLIVDSNIGIELPISAVDLQGIKKTELITLNIKLKRLSLDKLNCYLEPTISTYSQPQNKLRFKINILLK